MQIIEPLVTIMTAMEVNFFSIDGCSVIIATGRLLTKSFRFASANQVVQIKYIEVIECLLTVPASKDVQIVADFVAGVCRAA